MDEDEFARSLLAHERRDWQDPDRILSQLPLGRGMGVADLACGPGFFTVPLARAVEDSGTVYAVDNSPLMLKYLRSILKRASVRPQVVKIIESDAAHTGIPPETCDLVLFANILHDLERPDEFLAEVKRISKPGATVVDIDWRNDLDNGFGPPVEIRLGEAKARELLLRNGLKVVGSIDSGPYHYGIALRK
jgi:ubiquinone/menaquinone biosynthesis C-methylase UbiE